MMQARQPRGEIELRRPDAGPVPVDKHGAAVSKTEVVAPHVAVQKGDTAQFCGRRRRRELIGKPVEPCLVEHAERERTRRVVPHGVPSLVDGEQDPEVVVDRIGRGCPLDLVQRRQDSVDVRPGPRRRPDGVRKILDHEDGRIAIVVPPDHLGQVAVPRKRLVVGVLEPEPVRDVVERGHLREGRRPVVERHPPSPVGGRAVADDGLQSAGTRSGRQFDPLCIVHGASSHPRR